MTYRFNVSEARTAMACPRVFYFDVVRSRETGGTKRITRVWSGASTAATAAGGLFHNAVEKFNELARTAPKVREALQAVSTDSPQQRNENLRNKLLQFAGDSCIKFQRLAEMSPPRVDAFRDTFHRYMDELADVLAYAIVEGRSVDQILDEFFSDHSKRVDVTFDIGPGKERVNLRGSIDYIYFDYRVPSDRIIDFKLTSSEAFAKDLTQVALYSLMHHQQHQTKCSAAVLYLYPKRIMAERSWTEICDQRHSLFDLLASMVAWSQYDEKANVGVKPPGEPGLCATCRWNKHGECEARLGDKETGHRLIHWTERARQDINAEPQVEHANPPGIPDPVDFDEIEDTDTLVTTDSPTAIPQPKTANPTSPSDNLSDKGLVLGKTLSENQSVVMPLAALNTHIAVVGAAGSGKSWMAKVIAEEAIANQIPILAIDPQGDLVQFMHPATVDSDMSSEDRARLDAFRQKVDVRIWTPGTSHGIRLSLSPFRLPSESQLQAIESPQRRREEWDAMLGVAASNLVSLAAAAGDHDVQNTFVLELLRKLVEGRANGYTPTLNEIIAAIDAPDSIGVIDADLMISKSVREKLKQRLYAKLRGTTSHLFSDGTALDLDRFVNPESQGKVPLNVIYLNALSDDNQKQYFVASLAAEIYRWMITTPSSPQTRLLLYLDEAKDYLPAGTRLPPAKAPLLRLFAQGRKFGVGCLICTQSPRSVDYQAFSNASTKLVGRLEAAQDVQRVAEWFTDSSGVPSWLAGRNGAERGTFVGRWPGAGSHTDGQVFRSRKLYSQHEAAWPPSRVETEWAKSNQAKIFTT